jgi:hypothetical protein
MVMLVNIAAPVPATKALKFDHRRRTTADIHVA